MTATIYDLEGESLFPEPKTRRPDLCLETLEEARKDLLAACNRKMSWAEYLEGSWAIGPNGMNVWQDGKLVNVWRWPEKA